MQGKRERRMLWLAVGASLVVHLLVGLSLAALSGPSSPVPPLDDQPVQLTMMDLSATPPARAKPNPAYIETDPAKEAPEPPKEKTFESNANSIAASKAPAAGDAPLPSQEGREQPFLNMETQEHSLAAEGSKARPEPTPPPLPSIAPTPVSTPKARPSEAPKATPIPTAKPEPTAPSEPEQLAMLRATPPPALRDPSEAEETPVEGRPTAPPVFTRPQTERAAAAYRPEKLQTRITGRISDRGPSAANAVGTPLGKYQKTVSDAIGSRWYFYMKSKMDLVSIGTAHVEAEVDAQGKLQNLRVLSNDANEAFANICLQSFQEAQIPPIPPDLIATLPEGRLPVDIFFTMYSNR